MGPMKTDLPPEAFTKETLQKAFNWLQEQPETLRASVHTPERLVSLFQKSQRFNDNDAPVSSKKFIDDLKNLATSLDQFGSRPKAFAPTNPPPQQPVEEEKWEQALESKVNESVPPANPGPAAGKPLPTSPWRPAPMMEKPEMKTENRKPALPLDSLSQKRVD